MKPIGLRAKLVRVFALQILLISAATLVGIYATYRIINDVLVRAALRDEASHYWTLFEADPATPMPNTANLRGYLQRGDNVDAVPEALRGQPAGYRRIAMGDDDPLVHISEQVTDDGEYRLFLIFLEERVANLVFYFGIVPLSIVLLSIYGLLFFTYRMSQRAISPVVQLANDLERFDFSQSGELQLDLAPYLNSADAEILSMAQAVNHFAERVEALVKRERTFTRDASHELRTPLAVIRGSLDLLERNKDRTASDLAALGRMRKTVEDMEALLQTLLLLARGHEIALPAESIAVNQIVAEQLQLLRPLAEQRGNSLEMKESARLEVRAPPRVLAMLVGNLLRNAINYTREGRISVQIEPGRLIIEDSGIGMNETELSQVFEPFFRGDGSRENPDMKGHGLGLAIVKRLANQFNWPLSITSQPGAGTRVMVELH